jgi:hypothetical protein
MLEETNRLCTERCEYTDARKDTKTGYYERGIKTEAEKVRLKIPNYNRIKQERKRPISRQ